MKWQTMFFIKYVVLFLRISRFVPSQQEDVSFTYNGFQGVDMSLDGFAHITDNGLLRMANSSTEPQMGHAFYPHLIHLRNSSTGTALSFSTTLVFVIFSEFTTTAGNGIMFVIAPSPKFPGALPGSHIGLFNMTNLGVSSNHLIGVELDTIQNEEFNDINSNHVGIDINDLKSVKSTPASYFSYQENQYVNLSLMSGQPMQLWVEYDATNKQLNVTLSPIAIPKPTIPLLSLKIDISHIIVDPMFVGFASSSGIVSTTYYLLGWSFKMNGQAKQLSLSQLPKLPRVGPPKTESRFFKIGFSVMGASLVLMLVFVIQYIVARKRKFAEVLEDWELEHGPHRFKYKDLYIATKGFNDKELLGKGGFGKVYKGILPISKQEVAVKRVSHDSRQGVREFIAEIVSIRKLQHQNIVALLGYCRRKGELLLVYEFMPNGSLDKFLFHQSTTKTTLSWNQRFQIIKGLASALLYLHEKCEQVVVHRDIKSGNVMLDKELNGKLGDFGLARLYDHGDDPKTTNVVGTLGYLAPEIFKTGKANPCVDVFSFGIFMLEVACGRRPIERQASEDRIALVEWVFSSWSRATILETVDPKLEMNYEVEEMELVLKLGLLCSRFVPSARPSMLQIVRYLEKELPLPEMPASLRQSSYLSSDCFGNAMNLSYSIADSQLSGGR